jgi:hypothetical protein
MFLEDYELLCAYWIEHPPLQMMVQAYLGIDTSKAPKQPQGQQMLP